MNAEYDGRYGPLDGWIDGITNEDYHRTLPGVSSSGLKDLLDCPARYKYKQAHPKPPTDAMNFGTLVHLALLEPAEWMRVVVEPEVNKRTNAGKAELAEWRASLSDDVIVTDQSTKTAVEDAAGGVLENSECVDLLNGGVREGSGFLTIQDYGVFVKIRPDNRLVDQKGGIIVDVKTCREGAANPRQWPREVATYKYHLSAALYMDVANAIDEGAVFYHTFAWLVVESVQPYLATVHYASHDCLTNGAMEYMAAVQLLADCQTTGRWPGYKSATIDLPAWARTYDSGGDACAE